MLDQVEGDQYRLSATATATQRMEVRSAIVVEDHGLAVDQK
jgi:hypothetical protein